MKAKLEQILLLIKGYSPEKRLNEAYLGNILSLIHHELGNESWVGIYKLDNNELILSLFQGTPGCEIIQIGRGVVGTSFKEGKTVSINDVSKIDNYICCDVTAKSEICIPLYNKDKKIIAIFDIDLPFVHEFDEDIKLFEDIAKTIERFI